MDSALIDFFDILNKYCKVFQPNEPIDKNALVNSLKWEVMKNDANYSIVKVTEDGNQKVMFGRLFLKDFRDLLLKGDSKKAFSDSINHNLDPQIEKTFNEFVMVYPTARISKIIKTQLMTEKRINTLTTAKDIDDLSKNNDAFKKWASSNDNKIVGYLAQSNFKKDESLGKQVEEHRNKMKFCNRYVYDSSTKNTTICKIAEFSCGETPVPNKCLLNESEIRAEVGAIVYDDGCKEVKEGCKHCNSLKNDPDISAKINIAYYCDPPTILGAFVDMIQDESELDAILNEYAETKNFFKRYFWLIILIIGVVLIFLLKYFNVLPEFSLSDDTKEIKKMKF